MAHAYAVFYPNCSLPTHSVAYVAASGTRGTLDIHWSSLATIIACTYTVLHMNVPEQRQGRDPGWRGDMVWSLRRLKTSFKWTLITILAPEYVLAKAFVDYLNARKQLKLLHRSHPSHRHYWSMTHMLFADMGGFVLSYAESGLTECNRTEENPSSPTTAPSYVESAILEGNTTEGICGSLTSVPSYNESGCSEDDGPAEILNTLMPVPCSGPNDIAMAPISSAQYVRNTQNTESVPLRKSLWHLDAKTLRSAIESDYLAPTIVHTEEILDKSKSDLFTKVLTIAQTSYFVVAVLARVRRGLPVSQLELGVCGFVICSAFTYGFSMSKPKSVTTAIIVRDYGTASLPPSMLTILKSSEPGNLFSSFQPSGGCLRNDIFYGDINQTLSGIALFSTAIVLGCVHMAG